MKFSLSGIRLAIIFLITAMAIIGAGAQEATLVETASMPLKDDNSLGSATALLNGARGRS